MTTLRDRIEDLIEMRRLTVEEYRGLLAEEDDPETVHVIVMLMAKTEEILAELQTILDETL